jgi:DNA-binding transcriptional LysR family regulator
MSQFLPSLNALRAFDATARTLSVSRAAEQLHVTHGAVSRQIRQLEQQLDVTLFQREGRGLKLTPDGEQLCAVTSQAFDQLTQVCTQLKRRAEDAPLVLGCPGSFLARWFIPRLGALQSECPTLAVHLTASEEAQWPLGSTVDAALRFAEPPWPDDAEVIDLAPELMGPVLKPELLAGVGHDDPSALYQLPLLHTQSRAEAWPIWFEQMGLDQQRIRRDQVFEHLNYMLEAALVGLGVAIAPAYLVEEDLRTGRLVAPWGFVETRARLGLWLPKGRQDRRTDALARWLRASLGRLDLEPVQFAVQL